jgi:hypothetical protein
MEVQADPVCIDLRNIGVEETFQKINDGWYLKQLRTGGRMRKGGGGNFEFALCPPVLNNSKGPNVANVLFDYLITKTNMELNEKYILCALALASTRYKTGVPKPNTDPFHGNTKYYETVRVSYRDPLTEESQKAISMTLDDKFENQLEALPISSKFLIELHYEDFHLTLSKDEPTNEYIFILNVIDTDYGTQIAYEESNKEVYDKLSEIGSRSREPNFFSMLAAVLAKLDPSVLEASKNGGSSNSSYKKIAIKKHILGRDRCIYVKERKQYIKYKNQMLSIVDARKL